MKNTDLRRFNNEKQIYVDIRMQHTALHRSNNKNTDLRRHSNKNAGLRRLKNEKHRFT
jgi:hypothetical protein